VGSAAVWFPAILAQSADSFTIATLFSPEEDYAMYKHTPLLTAISLMLALSACNTAPSNTTDPEPSAVQFLGELSLITGSEGTTPSLEFVPSGVPNPDSIKVLPGATSNFGSLLNASFMVQNLTGSTLKNLVMVAKYQPSNLFDTAIETITDASNVAVSGLTAAQVQGIKPTHGMLSATAVNPTRADLHLLRQAEVDALTAEAGTGLKAGEYLFNYGYGVKNTAGGATISGVGPSRLTNRVTVGLNLGSLPATNKYKLSFLLFTLGKEARTQSLEETATTMVSGQLQTSVNIVALPEVRVLPTSTYPGLNRLTVCDVRTAGPKTAPLAYLGGTSVAAACTNEPPKLKGTMPVTFSVLENSAVGTVIGTVVGTDVEGHTITYTVTGDVNNNSVPDTAIHPSTGVLTVNDPDAFDFETNPSINVSVKLTDNGMPSNSSTTTVAVGVGDVIESGRISIGYFHTCAIDTDNKAFCWGADGSGQLGNGTITGSQISPVAVDTTKTWKSISAGESHTCAIDTDNKAFCWGADNFGQLGNGTITGDQTGPSAVDSTKTWKSISAGFYHTCAIDSDNEAFCWGFYGNGQLGNGAPADNQTSPSAVDSTKTWKSISAGFYHTCAIDSDNKAFCWGNDGNGQLGNGAPTVDQTSPSAVDSTKTWKSISVGFFHTCAIDSANKAFCWGYDAFGLLGNGAITGDKDSPFAVNSTKTWKSIRSGAYHSCAIDSTDKAFCWGADYVGQLGNGATSGDQDSPFAVNSTNTWSEIGAAASDYSSSCALSTSNTFFCWGNDDRGQLGNGATTGDQQSPVQVVFP
jgi:alpha-tubulin suppressor-like RCC1 family protein